MNDLPDIRRAIVNDLESVLHDLFAPGRIHRSGRHLRVDGLHLGGLEVVRDGPGRGNWFLHADHVGGDPLSLVAYAVAGDRRAVGAAADWMRNRGPGAFPSRAAPAPRRLRRHTVLAVLPRAPANAPATFPRGQRPTRVWTWRDAAGQVVGHTYRLDWTLADGTRRKSVLPLAWARVRDELTGEVIERWWSTALPAPRPLYRLPELLARRGLPVLLVEGEKTVDAAQAIFPDWRVTTWAGGAGAMAKTDFSPLADADRLVYWPDADAPNAITGARAGVQAAEALDAQCRRLHVVGLGTQAFRDGPAGLVRQVGSDGGLFDVVPEGWDLADPPPAGWDRGRLEELLQAADTLAPRPETQSWRSRGIG